jgi:hypothetical protein
VKKRVAASQWFRSVDGAVNTIAGYEVMNIIRKGQIRWLPKADIVGQLRFIETHVGHCNLISTNSLGFRFPLVCLRHCPSSTR